MLPIIGIVAAIVAVSLLVVVGMIFLMPGSDSAQFASTETGSGAPSSGNGVFDPAIANKKAKPRRVSETRDRVLKDVRLVLKEIESSGKNIPVDDESEETAQELMKGVEELKPFLLRACEIRPIPVALQSGYLSLGKTNTRENEQPVMRGSKYFWSIDTTNTKGRPVTEAFNQLTSSRMAILGHLNVGLIELPSPLNNDHPEIEWTDEDRRVLEIIRARGRFNRDFVFELAPIHVDSPSENSLLLLHGVIDKYVNEGLEIAKLPGESGVLAEVPRNSPYQQQQRASAVTVIRLRWQKFGNPLMGEVKIVDPQLAWLLDEFDRVNESLEDLTFFAGKRAKLPGNRSVERYLEFVKAEQLAQQKAEEEKKKAEAEAARQLEQQRLAEIEKKKKQEEGARKAERDRLASQQAKNEFKDALRNPNSPFRGPGGSPRGAGRGSQGGFRTPGGGNPFQDRMDINRPGRPRSGPPSDVGRDKSNDVTIKVANIKNIDSRTIVTDVPDWLRKYGLRSHRNNADLTITIMNFDRPLADLKRAFPQLEFDKIDDKTRTITASEIGS